jgi:hypothetical protein
MRTFQWSDGSGLLLLELTEEVVNTCSHQGQCDADVEATRHNCPEVETQLKALDPDRVRKCLKEYGAWSDKDLESIEDCLDRILWIACGDCKENPEFYL